MTLLEKNGDQAGRGKTNKKSGAKPMVHGTLWALQRETNCTVPTLTIHCLYGFCGRYLAYSYGGGGEEGGIGASDGSVNPSPARASIRSNAASFVDISAAGHSESVARIHNDGVDILVDLQGHTLRGRNEIAACRPARLQVRHFCTGGTIL